MKYEVLQMLREGEPGYVSGEALSRTLGVSRTAIWKYINELKDEGYVIEASSKKGYRMDPSGDLLNAFEIKSNSRADLLGRNVLYFKSLDSTNNYAKKIASEGCEEGTVVIAGRQLSGRGRLGRLWSSSSEKGVWMSVVLKPSVNPQEVQIITLAASVAVILAIKKVTGITGGIKWPNDIILKGKKVCGILTEMNSELDKINYVILGIGINVNQEAGDFPEDIRQVATSLRCFAMESGMLLKEKSDKSDTKLIANMGSEGIFNRSEIMKELLFHLERFYDDINKGCISHIIDLWKQYSITLNMEVEFTQKDVKYRGRALDITGDGKLVVKCQDGSIREILFGEVSVRGILGYA